ncbi:MAG: BON domain-containing protein [Methylococcales bacterium]|nr:BON domain-containing protein [Methylococcales bacterium]
MNRLKFLTLFLLSVLSLTVIPACSTENAKRESTGEYFDDTVLTTKIKSTFLGDSRLKMLDINVKTFKGTVQISGFVDTQKEADRAVQLARTIKGVKAVNNRLIVKP